MENIADMFQSKDFGNLGEVLGNIAKQKRDIELEWAKMPKAECAHSRTVYWVYEDRRTLHCNWCHKAVPETEENINRQMV